MSQPPFPNLARVDARDKVCGALKYAADDVRPNLAHAMLAVATIGRGRVVAIDTAAARQVEGVLLILTHEDLADVKSAGYLFAEGYGFQSFQPMLGPAASPIEASRLRSSWRKHSRPPAEGASLVRADLRGRTVHRDDSTARARKRSIRPSAIPIPMFADRIAGDADEAFAAADVQIDEVYEGSPQHQNPMELLTTIAEWHDGTLTIHEPSQNSGAIQHGVARALGIEPERVHVIAWSAGGGFGQKNSLQMHTVPVAVAARRLGRPVKIVVPRCQIYHSASFRPATRHHVRLGADRDRADGCSDPRGEATDVTSRFVSRAWRPT